MESPLKSERLRHGPGVVTHSWANLSLLSGKDGIIFHLLAITPFQSGGNSYAQDIRMINSLTTASQSAFWLQFVWRIGYKNINQFLSRLQTTLNESVTNKFSPLRAKEIGPGTPWPWVVLLYVVVPWLPSLGIVPKSQAVGWPSWVTIVGTASPRTLLFGLTKSSVPAWNF
jgi:hypothetical protein